MGRTPQVGTPAGMRELNQRAVLDRLRAYGPATRPQVAKDTGLSKPTVGQALLDLERRKLVREIGRTSTGPGRSAVVYEENPAAGFVLGVDIGGERIRLEVADLAGTVVSRVDERNRCRSARSLVQLVRELADQTVAAADIGFGDVVAKVVGSPGCPTRVPVRSATPRTYPAGAGAACWRSSATPSALAWSWRTTPTWPRSAS
ncbi:hypothetical protein GCM10029964_108510 [Kibdelosporangium lantanae]